MPRCVLPVIVPLVLLSFPSVAPAQEPEFRRMPWHLVDLWWDLGEERDFESYEIDLTVSDTISPEKRLYIAPVGIAHLSGTPFYGGMQTQLDGYTAADRRLRRLGPGFIMSMWGQRSLEAIRPSQGGYLQSSGHEGDFVSVRRPFTWQAGKYTFRYVAMETQQAGEQVFTWMGNFIEVHATGENIFAGALRFPGEKLRLSRKVASFVEVYGPAIPVDEIPQLTFHFGNLRVNGEPIDPASVVAVYPAKVPDYADAAWTGSEVAIEVGQAVAGRTARQVELRKEQ